MLCFKLGIDTPSIPLCEEFDLACIADLERFINLLKQYIDLAQIRILEGEIIPHEKKMLFNYDVYTECINKGTSRPTVE